LRNTLLKFCFSVTFLWGVFMSEQCGLLVFVVFLVLAIVCKALVRPPLFMRAQQGVLLPDDAQKNIEAAVCAWIAVRYRDDEQWHLAFIYLKEAIDQANCLDIRLFMYSHSEEAAELFRCYESENCD